MTMIKPHVHVETRFDQRTRIYALRMYVRASMQSITPVCAHGRRAISFLRQNLIKLWRGGYKYLEHLEI